MFNFKNADERGEEDDESEGPLPLMSKGKESEEKESEPVQAAREAGIFIQDDD